MMRAQTYKVLYGFGISLGLLGNFANADTNAQGAMATPGAVRVEIASTMSYATDPRSSYKWKHVQAQPNTTADESLENPAPASSFKWNNAFSGQNVASQTFAERNFASSNALQAGYRWGIKSDAEQTGYRWGIKSDAEQTGYRWGIKSDAEQTGYRWGIKSAAEQTGYRWGIKSAAEQTGYRWGIKSAAEQTGYRFGIK